MATSALTFTLDGQAVYSAVSFSSSPCIRDSLWSLDSEEGDIGVLSALLDPATWDVEDLFDLHETLTDEVKVQLG